MTEGRLLIVDDETAQLRRCATRWAWRATRPRASIRHRPRLAALRPGEFDLLLTDLQMPAMDGIALIEAARKVDPDLGAIVMTATAPSTLRCSPCATVRWTTSPSRSG